MRNTFSNNIKFVTKRDLYQSLEIRLDQKVSSEEVRK